MKRIVFSLIALVALVMNSCKPEYIFPVASGRPYEILVVMDSTDWNAPYGRALFNALDTDVPCLPQKEPSFHVSQCQVASFDNTLNLFRNIILVKIDRTLYFKTRMKFTRNKWAMDQVVLTIQSPDEESFKTYCEEHKADIVKFFTRSEMNRLVGELKGKHSKIVEHLADSMFNCQLWAPDEITNSKKGENFFWAANMSGADWLSICMYSYPYEGAETMNEAYVIHKRDSVMKVNIPGAEEGMYMTTDTMRQCIVKPITVHGEYCLETRGGWEMHNDAMAGPFVSHSRVDTISKRVIVVEGFVFAPDKMKRGYIRRLEGCLYSLLLPQEKSRELDTGVEEEKEDSTQQATRRKE